MKKQIAVLAGDGVGPEVTKEAVKVLKKVAKKFSHDFSFKEGLIGAIAIDTVENPYPDETHKLCLESDAVLFGAIGDPRFDNNPKAKVRPEQGLLKMRKALGLYANVRPIIAFEGFTSKSPLKAEIIEGVDFIVIRELTGGIYFGEPRGRSENGEKAFDTCVYSKDEILRVSKFAFDLAMKRGKKITVVDKANVLATSRLWRETTQEFAKQYPEVTVDYMFVDNASMQIIKRPSVFDVVLTENMFGDILTDEASVITGSLGMLPSASIGERTAVYEPIHGSYPKAKGTNTANPIGAILSAEMLLRYSFEMHKEADVINQAVIAVLTSGKGTKDIVDANPISTSEMGDAVINMI
ncbi:MAG: 3-isopropylmalate dehydrogenase [Candidatus Roizmanbacteria bacterium]